MLGLDPQKFRKALEADGEFRRASRAWTGSFAFSDGASFLSASLVNGVITEASVTNDAPSAAGFEGPAEGWQRVFAAVPPPYYQDLLGGACAHHGFAPFGDLAALAAYYGAIQRAAILAGQVFRGEA